MSPRRERSPRRPRPACRRSSRATATTWAPERAASYTAILPTALVAPTIRMRLPTIEPSLRRARRALVTGAGSVARRSPRCVGRGGGGGRVRHRAALHPAAGTEPEEEDTDPGSAVLRRQRRIQARCPLHPSLVLILPEPGGGPRDHRDSERTPRRAPAARAEAGKALPTRSGSTRRVRPESSSRPAFRPSSSRPSLPCNLQGPNYISRSPSAPSPRPVGQAVQQDLGGTAAPCSVHPACDHDGEKPHPDRHDGRHGTREMRPDA